MAQIALSLNLRRLLKKIEDAKGEAAIAAFSELPKDLDDEALLQALLPFTSRQDLSSALATAIMRKDIKDYSQLSQAVVTQWTSSIIKNLSEQEVQNYSRWFLYGSYRAELLHPQNAELAPFIHVLSNLMQTDPNNILEWFQNYFFLFDCWVAAMTDEQIQNISPTLSTQLSENNLIKLFSMLSDLPNYDRSRGGPLPALPWLRLINTLWQSQIPVLENVACAFIKGWKVDSDDTSVLDQMIKILDHAPSDTKSHVKAGLFRFSTPFIQYLAKNPLKNPIFDPVTCYQIVNRSEPDTTYDATKWALQYADPAKLCDLVNAVTEDVVKGTSSVLRRFPAFFLLVDSLCKAWENTHDQRKADLASAVHTLGRHWSLYRPQFEREATAESQSHYFTSNADIVEASLGKVLARTLV